MNVPEGSQRVGAQEVVEADVLVSSDVDHLERRCGVSGGGWTQSVSLLEGHGLVGRRPRMNSFR